MVDAWGNDERDDDPLARLERLVNARTHRMTGPPEPSSRPAATASSLRGAIDDLYGTPEGAREGAREGTRQHSPAISAAASRMPELPVMDMHRDMHGADESADLEVGLAAPRPADPFDAIADLDDALARVLNDTAPRAPSEPFDLPPLDIEAELAHDPALDLPAPDLAPAPSPASTADLPPSLAALRGDWPGMAPTSAPAPMSAPLSAPVSASMSASLPPMLEEADPLPRFLRHVDDAAAPADHDAQRFDDQSLDGQHVDPRFLDAQFDAALDAEMDEGLNDAVSGALAAATAALAATSTQRPSDRPAAIAPLAVPAPPAYTASEEPVTAPIEFGDDFERELVDELLQIEPGAPVAIPDDPLVAPAAMRLDDPDEDERPAPANDNGGRRRGAMVAAMLAGVAVIGGLAAFSLGGGTDAPTEVALIRADPAPAKVRPAEPGGRTVPNQSNAVYERVAKVETAQARAAQPVAPPALVDKTEDVSTIREAVMREPARTPPESVARLDAVDVSPRNVYAPRAVRTIQVGPDGTLVSNEPVRTPPVADALASAAGNVNPVVAAVQGTLGDALGDTLGASIEGTPAPGMPLPRFRPAGLTTATLSAPVQVASTAATAPAARASTPITPGGYVVQIASVPSADAARRTYGQLASRFGSVIGGRGVDYQVANIPGKGTFHRVRIPAASKADASATCSALKSAGGSCFVTR